MDFNFKETKDSCREIMTKLVKNESKILRIVKILKSVLQLSKSLEQT
jgi:hypothetical protein